MGCGRVPKVQHGASAEWICYYVSIKIEDFQEKMVKFAVEKADVDRLAKALNVFPLYPLSDISAQCRVLYFRVGGTDLPR